MKRRDLDVVAVGEGTIDLVLETDGLPGHDQKVMGRLVGWLPGGTVPNFACAASRLGLRVGFLGTVGDDEAGRTVIEDFRIRGVGVDHLRVVQGQRTNFTVIMVDATGERAIVVVPVYRYEPILDAEARAYLARAWTCYTMPVDQQGFQQLTAACRQVGTQVAIDVEPTLGADMEALRAILPRTDIAFFNREGLTAATESLDLWAGARQMLALGPQIVVITRGRHGALALTRHSQAEHPGFTVDVVDTTGAGDCFNAAFLVGYRRGWKLEETLAFANAAGALSVTKMGPRAGLPTPEAVSAFLARHHQITLQASP